MADTSSSAVNYDDVDALLPTAPQIVATRILVPCIVGWGLQLFLSGVAAMRALPHMRRRQAIPGARILLIVATLANLLLAACVYWEIAAYMIDQARSTSDLNAYKLADVLNPIPAGISATATQVFMTIRCWRIANRNIWILATMIMLMAGVLSGWLWGAVYNWLYSEDQLVAVDMFAPTELWLWSSAGIDICITLVLVLHLVRFKKHTSRRSEPYVDSLIRLSFETLSVPTVLNGMAAVIYICTWRHPYWWNLMTAPLPMIPSCYVLSFVYCLEGTQARVHNTIPRTTKTVAQDPTDKDEHHIEAYNIDMLECPCGIDSGASTHDPSANQATDPTCADARRRASPDDYTHIVRPMQVMQAQTV